MATNYAKASYTEVIDLQTVAGKTSVIGIHTPQGRSPYDKLKGFFTQFRKYRYKGISRLTIAPASALPVDPLGLTVEPDTPNQMNPQDTLNPILFKGCHGTTMDQILDRMFNVEEYVNSGGYNASTNAIDECSPSLRKWDEQNDYLLHYYEFLTDTTWRKYGVQQIINIKRLFPLIWKMARNLPINPSFNGNQGVLSGLAVNNSTVFNATPYVSANALGGTVTTAPFQNDPNVGIWGKEYAQEFTNGCARLGWLPTVIPVQTTETPQYHISGLPKLFMGVFVLPPAYSKEQYMRMVIRHEFEFKDFTSSLGAMSNYPLKTPDSPVPSNYFNFIDYGDSKIAIGDTIDMLDGTADLKSDGVL